LHFHVNSEHTISKKKFAGELHMVFARTADGVIEDNNCVIGILIDVKDNENEATKQERDIL
jgi:carbonic anhydrase